MNSAQRRRISIVGGSGYTAGELLRILLFHPHADIVQVASGSMAGHYVHRLHPNLRALCALRFCRPDDLVPCDVLFLCLPHGVAAETLARYRQLAPLIIDLSADFRLRSPALYARWYGREHPMPEILSQAVYGLPELHREELPGASLISGTGCMATAALLGLAPLYRAGLVDPGRPLVIEAKIGSSAAGASPGAGSHHPDRSGALRSFQPTGHRHSAELIQELGALQGADIARTLAFSATAVELVRGILVTAHVFVEQECHERTLWDIYRAAYQHEPFVRIVKERSGVYRYPEPKIVAGSNYCDVGFELEGEQRRVVVMAALDNLGKGAAGNAVQALNCHYAWDETSGLTFPGLHPV
ncbi:MAG TPA: N-acetyl-gamma-glutamyl-phosphate reductase [Ktedonobacteraceae bacterium]|jgi:N-acetyl-gamma-glutamyl-phosphate/LysW-gamma-L-alpha-aminoadipyl-6-phosphate reductase